MKLTANNWIWDLWLNGSYTSDDNTIHARAFIGENGATHGRVTVETGYALQHSSTTDPNWDKSPLRWFQRTDNSQVETEIPRVLTIDIDRSLDNDAATMKFVMINQQMDSNTILGPSGTRENFGEPGYYWPGHGDSADSTTFWGFTTNSWNNVLGPNALIRTYQGYGGKSKTISQALTDGNLVQTGTWLIDSVEMDAKTGMMTISCRDMAKLLIEQELYPPLVPVGLNQSAHYPLYYKRWTFIDHPVVPYGATVYNVGFQEKEGALTTGTSSGDASGHPSHDAIDGVDPDSYWLSDGALTETAHAYVQFAVGATAQYGGSTLINGINIQPYGGNYTMYVSVHLNGGGWTGSDDDGIGLNYVSKQGVGWEHAATIDLGTTGYDADFIRLTFTHLHLTSLGPGFYRAGVRDLQVGLFTSTASGGGRVVVDISRSNNDSNNGYWVTGSDGGVYTFGNAKGLGSEAKAILNSQIVAMASHPGTGKGYRMAGGDGGVFCFGDMRYKGSLPGQGVVVGNIADISNGSAGAGGYYLLGTDGMVYTFGDADDFGIASGTGPGTFGDDSDCCAMVASSDGYWILNQSGYVHRVGSGAGTFGGSYGQAGNMVDIEMASDQSGLWIVSDTGQVYTENGASYHGNAPGGLNGLITAMVRTYTDNGYWLVGDDGGVFTFGDAKFSGSLPEQFHAVGEGNYKDYLDIIKDLLLWSGWWYRDPTLGDATPANVFGNLESTGIYAPDPLTEDFFDKKPVIDVINTIKEVVGYITYADEEGAYHFETPNIWSQGNFWDTGVRNTRMPTIDESLQIIEYQVDINDTDARSLITIATDDPTLGLTDTKSVTIVSQWGGDLLRGMCRPALWVNGQFLTTEIQTTMAHLIDLHMFLQQRRGTLTMPANPILQIDDQVKIVERSTSETYVHYIRGYSTHMDIQTGEYTQTLQTHWMGDDATWFLTYAPPA